MAKQKLVCYQCISHEQLQSLVFLLLEAMGYQAYYEKGGGVSIEKVDDGS